MSGQILVLVPAAVIELDEAHVALGEPAREQAVGRVGSGLACSGPHLEHRVRLLRQIHQVGHRRLHPIRHHAGRCASRSPDRRRRRGASRSACGRRRASRGACAWRRREDPRGRAPARCRCGSAPLITGRQEPAGPETREERLIGVERLRLRQQHDERRQVLVLAAAGRSSATRPCSAAPGCGNPVWITVIAGSWLIASVFIVLITVMSSTIFAVCGRAR